VWSRFFLDPDHALERIRDAKTRWRDEVDGDPWIKRSERATVGDCADLWGLKPRAGTQGLEEFVGLGVGSFLHFETSSSLQLVPTERHMPAE